MLNEPYFSKIEPMASGHSQANFHPGCQIFDVCSKKIRKTYLIYNVQCVIFTGKLR